MGTMPGKVAHTPVFEGFDQVISSDPQSFLTAYENAKGIQELLDDAVSRGILTPSGRQHVEDDWLKGGLFAKPLEDADAILIRGLLWAARLALYPEGDPKQPPLSATRAIHTLWICAFKKKSGRLEVVCCASDAQVTVLLLTPMPVNAPPSADDGFQPIWTTRSETFGVEEGETLVEKVPPVVVVRPTY